jgi:hemerythrin
MVMTASAGQIATGGCLRLERTAHGEGASVYLQWIKAFETGSPEIDALHRELVEECNSLLLAVEYGVAWSRLLTDASRLVEGCIQHFRHEEELLAEARFPRTPEHIAEHRRIENELQGLISRMKMVDGSLEEHRACPREFGPILVELIIRHDLDYRSHLLHRQGR